MIPCPALTYVANSRKGRTFQRAGLHAQELGLKREDLVISTKIYWGGSGPNDKGLSRKHIIEGTKVVPIPHPLLLMLTGSCLHDLFKSLFSPLYSWVHHFNCVCANCGCRCLACSSACCIDASHRALISPLSGSESGAVQQLFTPEVHFQSRLVTVSWSIA